jgi:hypothetical protein
MAPDLDIDIDWPPLGTDEMSRLFNVGKQVIRNAAGRGEIPGAFKMGSNGCSRVLLLGNCYVMAGLRHRTPLRMTRCRFAGEAGGAPEVPKVGRRSKLRRASI